MTETPVIWSASSGPVDAPRIVLVHGSLDRSAGLLKLSRRLDERFRVTRYDRRGYGRSTPCSGPFGMSAQVGDLIGVIESGATPCVVVAHSFGGNIALAAAEQRRDLVRAVATYESPMSWEPWWPGGSAKMAATEWAADPGLGAELFMRRLIGDERWERLPPSTRAARRSEGPAMIGELAAISTVPPWNTDAVSVPVLAMHGEHAMPHHRRAMEELGGRWPDARVVSVGGARHFGPNTHPDDVAMLVTGFVSEIDVATTL